MSFSCNITQATSASTDGELTGWDEMDLVLSDSGAAALPNSVPPQDGEKVLHEL